MLKDLSEKVKKWCHHYEYLPFIESDLLSDCGYCIHSKKMKDKRSSIN